MTSFISRLQRLNRAVERSLANATGSWSGGKPFGLLVDQVPDEGFMGGEVVTAVRHTVSMCVANAPGIAEGSKGLRINGQQCVVAGAVVPDASGWATFPIYFEGAS